MTQRHGYSHSSQVQKAKRGYFRPHVITVLFWVTISAVSFELSVKAAVCFIHWSPLKAQSNMDTSPSQGTKLHTVHLLACFWEVEDNQGTSYP